VALVVQPAPADSYNIWDNDYAGIEANTWIQNDGNL